MNNEFPEPQSLDAGENKRVKVILLLGQSNATGSSITAYLKDNISPEQFARYEQGYESVLINYCLDDHNATSDGQFVPVDLTCGATTGFFGPEVGMAERLSALYPDREFFIVKCATGGTSLWRDWLSPSGGAEYDPNAYAESPEIAVHNVDNGLPMPTG